MFFQFCLLALAIVYVTLACLQRLIKERGYSFSRLVSIMEDQVKYI